MLAAALTFSVAAIAKLAGIVLWVGAVTFLLVSYMMAKLLLRPPRMDRVRAIVQLNRLTPDDLDMEYAEQVFPVRDGRSGRELKMAAWWIPLPGSNQTMVLLHGYSDAKVGAIAWAPLLRGMGFNILAVDLRAHGDSEGIYCTAGFWERHDLNQIINQLRAQRPAETAQLMLFGVSLGAAVACAAAVERDDLAGVVLECPFADYRSALRHYCSRRGMPGPAFQRMMFAWIRWMSGADFSQVRPVDLIARLSMPVMLIQSGDDPFLSPEELRAMRQALASRSAESGPGVCWSLEGTHHVLGICRDPAEYGRRVADFVGGVLQRAPVVCEK